MVGDYLNIVIKNLKRRKKRTFLTLVGIFIGITALVSLISIGYGLNKVIANQFEMMGADKIAIYPKGLFYGLMTSKKFCEDELNIIRKIKDVKTVAGMFTKISRVEYRDEIKYAWLYGIPQDEGKEIIKDMQNFKIKSGRDLKKTDKRKIVITKLFEEGKIFKNKVKIGSKIKIANKEFEVVGILKEIGNPEDDSSLIITLEDARMIFNESSNVDIIFIKVKKNVNTSKVVEEIKKELRRYRKLRKNEEDFVVETFEQIKESYNIVLNIVTIVLIGIAAISLIVGGIGIMNTMYTSVLERTREIGIMKALGAKNNQIMLLFLIEAGMLGLVGGIAGVIGGIAIAESVTFLAKTLGVTMLEAYFPLYLITGSLLFSFIIGSFAGMLPARKAALLKPVEALRYE